MRHKIFIILILIFAIFPLYSTTEKENIDFIVTFDSGVIDAIWSKHLYLRFGLNLISENGVGLEVPLSLLIDRSGGGEALFSSGVNLLFYPWQVGPFIALSLASVSIFVGPYLPEERIHYLNEIAFGYTYQFKEKYIVQGSIIYKDPSKSFEDDFYYINSLISGFQRFHFCLNFGYKAFTF
jgi:hypothetical protein